MKFRKKPVVIEAKRWTGNAADWREFYDFCKNERGVSELTGPHPARESSSLSRVSIVTLEGVMFAEPGDWIIRGVKGVYPCKPDIFELTYEAVE